MLFSFQAYAKEDGRSSVDNKQAQQQAESKISEKSSTPSLHDNTNIDASDYLQMLLGLFFIVAFIFSVAWLIKRMGTLNPNHSRDLKIVAGLSVGQREKIIVLQVMNEQLLIGVTQSSIQLLSKLDTPMALKNNANMAGFQEKLQAAIKGFKNQDRSGDKS